jgi:hypothetical protein
MVHSREDRIATMENTWTRADVGSKVEECYGKVCRDQIWRKVSDWLD